MDRKFTKIFRIGAAVAISAILLSGCANESQEDEIAYRKIGISSMELGDYEGAVAAFDSALKQHAGRITQTELDICYYKATAQFAGGDAQGALDTCGALLDYNGKDADAYYLRGCILLQEGEEGQAEEDFEAAVKYNADDISLYINIYENLAAYNLSDIGEEYLEKAFDVKGDSAEKLALRGRAYYLLGQYDNAVTELKAAREKESAVASFYLAQAYEALGDTENANACYQEYVESGEADSGAFAALAAIEMEKGSYQTALGYINQGLSLETVTDQKSLMRNKIICCEYLGDFDGAWAAMEEYAALYPEDDGAQREYVFLKYRQAGSSGEDSSEDADASAVEGTEET